MFNGQRPWHWAQDGDVIRYLAEEGPKSDRWLFENPEASEFASTVGPNYGPSSVLGIDAFT